MAEQTVDTNVPVDTIEKDPVREQERLEHENQISDNYRRLLEGTLAPERPQEPVRRESAPSRLGEETFAPAADFTEVRAPHIGASNEERIGAYRTPPAPAKKGLFEGERYVRGGYVGGPAAREAALPREEVFTAPAVEEYVSDEVYAAPVQEGSAEALPSSQTMLHKREEEQGQGVSFFSALSVRMKAALIGIAVAIVAAVMIICINTGILGSVHAEVSEKRLRLDRLTRSYRQLQERIEDATDPDHIDEWAQENGMVRG